MADTKRPTSAEDPHFETGPVRANRAIENGQGIGARELAAQRDPGGVNTDDEEPELEDGVSARPNDQQAGSDSKA